MNSFSIDGIAIKEVVAPLSPAELASVLGEAASQGRAVTPLGGGTKLAIGNVPSFVDLGISTSNLTHVLHYEPTDMTLSVEAGMQFADVQRLLAERGQTLPIEVPDGHTATIGGLIATAMAGPRRLGSGTLRDLLIGISVAYPGGIVGKAGGLVVKNVTGFDLMRLHLGAFGTLGIVTSANFKVLPLARTETTLVTGLTTLDAALAVASAARQSRLRPISAEVFADGERWRAGVRLEGRPETVALGVEAIRRTGWWETSLEAVDSSSWWERYVQRQSIVDPHGPVVIRMGRTPKHSGKLAQSVVKLMAKQGVPARLITVSPGLGTVTISVDQQVLTAEKLDALQRGAIALADTVTILSAPAEMKAGIDVWGAVPETIAVMRSLKAEFDGGNTLNPGRYVDRI
jgi:glycolate oxidase FAD binding subunit